MYVEIQGHAVTSPDASPISISLPPDKSILHRVLLIGSMTNASITIPIEDQHWMSHDVVATILALESLGVPVELFQTHIELQGVGLEGYRAPNHIINCANSGTTARLLMGLLAGQKFSAILSGDDSLSRRPMGRLSRLLVERMGANIQTAPEGTLPAMIHGQPLHSATIDLPVASAQMKTALLLAGMLAEGETRVSEPTQSRDHTECMLHAFGYGLTESEGYISVEGHRAFTLEEEFVYDIPGDLSSAAFIVAAAALLRKDVELKSVGLNPTRTRFLDILALMGVETEAHNIVTAWGEDRGDLTVFGSRVTRLEPIHITADDASLLIDELPVLGLLAAFAEGESSFEGVSELRVKEADRIHKLVTQLHEFGIGATERPDGFTVHGVPERVLVGKSVDHAGDHRLAMTFALAALFNESPLRIEQAEVVGISYPQFWKALQSLGGESNVRIVNGTATV